MPTETSTLPLANSVPAGKAVTAANYDAGGATTLNVQSSGSDWIEIPGTTQVQISPLASFTFVSNGVDGWRVLTRKTVPLNEIYQGAALVDITGTTQIVLSRETNQIWPQSFYFTVSGGDLVAIRPIWVWGDYGCIWTPNIANNEDAGIIINPVLRSGTGEVAGNLIGELFQSSRANTESMSASMSGLFRLDEGDVIGFDASDYTAQAGATDLVEFAVMFSTFGD